MQPTFSKYDPDLDILQRRASIVSLSRHALLPNNFIPFLFHIAIILFWLMANTFSIQMYSLSFHAFACVLDAQIRLNTYRYCAKTGIITHNLYLQTFFHLLTKWMCFECGRFLKWMKFSHIAIFETWFGKMYVLFLWNISDRSRVLIFYMPTVFSNAVPCVQPEIAGNIGYQIIMALH